MTALANTAETPVLEQAASGEYYCGKHPFVCGDVIRRFWPTKQAPRISLRFANEPSDGSVQLDFRLEYGSESDAYVWWRRNATCQWHKMYPELEEFLLTQHLVEAGAIRTLHVSVIIHEEVPMPDETRVQLTVEQAIDMLPDGEEIHTFRNAPGFALGGDWSREATIREIEAATRREIGGDQSQAVHHGLAIWTVTQGVVFVACRKDIDYAEVAKAASSEAPECSAV